jgi:competence protein ComEC
MTLFLAAFLMVLHNPYVLVFDISFQLSFIATLGLVTISPLVEKWFWVQKITARFGIREIVASTFATQIAVFPYILHRIGTLSIVSPLANLLVLPAIPAAMGVGALASVFELLTSLGSSPLSWVSYALLRYVSFVVTKLASFSWSAVTLPAFHWFFVLALYGLIIFWVYKSSRNPRTKKNVNKMRYT